MNRVCRKFLKEIKKRNKKSKKYYSDLYEHIGILLNVINELEEENNRLLKKIENIESESNFSNFDYKTLKDKEFVFTKSSPDHAKTVAQMENFVELLKQIEPNKVYGIVKNDNNDILFIYEEMIPKKEIEKLLY